VGSLISGYVLCVSCVIVYSMCLMFTVNVNVSMVDEIKQAEVLRLACSSLYT
jgi:hypothetical protein